MNHVRFKKVRVDKKVGNYPMGKISGIYYTNNSGKLCGIQRNITKECIDTVNRKLARNEISCVYIIIKK